MLLFIIIKKIGECDFWNLMIFICKFICKFNCNDYCNRILNFNFKIFLRSCRIGIILIVKCLINNLNKI